MKQLVLALLAIALFCTPAMAATEVSVDLEMLSKDARNAVINAQAAKNKAETVVTAIPEILKPENAEVLANYGTAIA